MMHQHFVCNSLDVILHFSRMSDLVHQASIERGHQILEKMHELEEQDGLVVTLQKDLHE